MMRTCVAAFTILALSTFRVVARAAHLRPSSKHPEVVQSLIQTEVSLNRQDNDSQDPEWAKKGILTMHGCECADHWSFDGYPHQGCAVVSDSNDHSISQPLCFVKDASKCKTGYNMSKLADVTGTTGKCENATCVNPTETTWDFCSRVEDISPYMTQKSCHCSAIWEFNSKSYNGCSHTTENEPSWCYVAETEEGCSEAQAAEGDKTHRWDFCDPPERKPAYLTRQGCHCKPTWKSNQQEYSSCVSKDELAWPSELKTSLDSEQTSLVGWCQVFEDGHVCPASVKSGGFAIDVCFMADEAEKTDLDVTFNGCHCQPDWTMNNETYHGCTAIGTETTPWCPVVEDRESCSQIHTQDTIPGRGAWNWDFCSDKSKNTTTMWRTKDDRFLPKQSEDMPD
eukprot:gnl/MRDRNA2_/MRDRNA2_108704_c0_seq1.p1 gnl/MRDRNA2_/MRDRNA2_108704_c0~~gnl/MRDRNA2_/MRDRNA2_108704_c0_seq1.p1  ORF type:complete len:396 (+),score=54.48 gnl/MRDRNA2_/MRDRNA2_108704_c0_seq1:58-1245(+)